MPIGICNTPFLYIHPLQRTWIYLYRKKSPRYTQNYYVFGILLDQFIYIEKNSTKIPLKSQKTRVFYWKKSLYIFLFYFYTFFGPKKYILRHFFCIYISDLIDELSQVLINQKGHAALATWPLDYSILLSASTGLILSSDLSVMKFTINAKTIASPAE